MTWSHWQGNRGRRRALGATTGSASATSPLPRQPTSIALHEGLGFTPGARIHHPARQRRFPPPPRPRHDDRGVRGEAGRRYWRVGSRATNQRSRRCQQRSFPSCVTRTLRERSRGWARPSASSPSSWCQVRAAVSSTLAWCSGNAWLCSHRSDARARSRPPSARLRNPALSLRPSASTIEDPDAIYATACAAAAEILDEIADFEFGGRIFTCRDSEGHAWTFGSHDPWGPSPSASCTDHRGVRHG